ncbi:alpha-L-arabinofuranosidase C-terminal domain-containing protein [Geofilum sp. OHC36d9]|uniref:alpha-L-arabinofuranosidase C-terminal domain-containing protein n=1 Tax=Geofilum sp. OHC36d9 TaxID=3458413 RepID=UPI004033A567
MRKQLLFFGLFLSLLSCQTQDVDMTIDVDLTSKGNKVPSSLYGIFFEEINHAGDGGLYGELLMNRSFEERVLPDKNYTVDNGDLLPPEVINHLEGHPTRGRFKWGNDPYPGWSLLKKGEAEASMELTTNSPNYLTAPTSMLVKVKNPLDGVSLVNSGYWGIHLKKDERYALRMIARTANTYKGNLVVRLIGANGKELAKETITTNNDGKWNEYKLFLTANDTTTVGKFCIDFPREGNFSFDYVSLFPEKTFKGRKNGMRSDVAEMLQGLNPAFIRWPGGCVVEGITLNNRIEWKQTIGDPAARPGEYDTWGYRSTGGFGYKEFLDFCEDTGAKGMFVCNVGIACQARTGEACSDKEAELFIQDALDAIEYAIGDVSTTWGAVRAKAGHPAPYPLSYVEIGNENFGPVYDKRFDMFYSAIKAKYPQLKLISNHGLGDGVKSVVKTDLIDPHWYVAPEYFFKNATIFDNIERGNYQIYVGEYACNQGVGGGNMLAALSEAAFITGMERNSDLVTMASYAPLLENVNDRGWPTNLIWMNNHQVMGRSSYYVQKMFADNMPSYNLNTTAEINLTEKEPFISQEGYVGFGTWSTQTMFRDLKVTDSKGEVIVADMNDASQWIVGKGEWESTDGAYTQLSNENRTTLIWNKAKIGAGSTIEFQAQKLGGSEGFLVYFGLENTDLGKGYMLNVGGWGNSVSAIETIHDNSSTTISEKVADKINENQWYNIKIVVSEFGAEYFVDGDLILTHESEPLNRKFHVAGYDEDTNEIIIKVVNATDKSSFTQININGAEVEKEGAVITLSAKSKEDENSLEDPYKIMPVEIQYNKFASSFVYEFKPNSLTILRLKRK